MTDPGPGSAGARRRGPRILIAGGGILLLLVLAGPPIAAVLLKDRAAAELSKALGRPASLKGLDLSLLGGLGIGLDSLEARDLGSAERLELKLGLLPLLAGKASVKRLVVRGGTYHHREGPLPFDVEGISLDLRASGLDLEGGLDPVALLQNATGDAEVSVGSVRGKGLDLTSLACRASLENGVAKLMEGKAELNQGSMGFSGTANVQDPRRPDFSARWTMAKVRITPDLLAAVAPASGVLLEGQLSEADLDLKWKGLKQADISASAAGRGRVKSAARTIDLSPLLPLAASAAKDLVVFTGFDAEFEIGNGVSTETVLLSAPDNGLKLTGTTRLSDHECDFTVQPTGRLGNFTGGRAIYLNGPLESLRINSAKMMEKEARRLLDEQVKQLLP